jgi:pimeloyl-ACP methyl ester carboxylesterase
MELIVNGQRAYAYNGGKTFNPALPCVVFIHGALNDHSVWTLLARWFANHGHSVLALDLPGHMRSAGQPLPSIEALADWTLAAMDAAGVRSSRLVGHSMGSLIALQAASIAPERVSALVMVGTAVPMKVSQVLLNLSRDNPNAAIDMVVTFSHSTLAAKPSYPGPGSWLRGGSRALMRKVQASSAHRSLFHHDFSVCNNYASGLQAAKSVTCPVTLILGRDDQMTQVKQAHEIAQALLATVHEIAAGHSLMTEAPEQLLGVLRMALK